MIIGTDLNKDSLGGRYETGCGKIDDSPGPENVRRIHGKNVIESGQNRDSGEISLVDIFDMTGF
jgi:hypothetical protein